MKMQIVRQDPGWFKLTIICTFHFKLFNFQSLIKSEGGQRPSVNRQLTRLFTAS